MKRFVALVLALMLCLSLCACGAGAGSPEKAVEKAFAKYDNTQDMYAALGIDKEASMKQQLMDMCKDYKLSDVKDAFLEDWPEAFSDTFYDDGDKISSLIGADKLDEYREKIANAESVEEVVDLIVELQILYYDTFYNEVREQSSFDSFTSESVVEKVDNICVRELEGKDYDDVVADFAKDYAKVSKVYLFGVSDIEAVYSVSFVITETNGSTENVDFDDDYYVLETSEGCFLYEK